MSEFEMEISPLCKVAPGSIDRETLAEWGRIDKRLRLLVKSVTEWAERKKGKR